MNAWSYFKRHFAARLKTIIIITAVCCLVCMLSLSPLIRMISAATQISTPNLWMPTAVLCIMSILAPILQFSTFKRRKNLDMWYSLPISRRDIGIAHFATGYLMVIIPFTVCVIQNILLLVLNGDFFKMNMSYCFIYYLLCILLSFALYSIYALAFNKANSIIDGIIYMVLWTFILPTVFLCLFSIYNKATLLYSSLKLIPFAPIIEITYHTEYTVSNGLVVDTKGIHQYFSDFFGTGGVGFITNTLLGFAAAAGNIFTFGRTRTENVEEHSNSWLGYKTLIPIYAIIIIIGIVYMDISNSSIVASILIGFTMVIAFVGYIIYRRGINFKPCDGVVMGIIGTVGMILPWVMNLISLR